MLECLALLLCNLVLSLAKTNNQQGCYDARVRHVIRTAAVQIYADSLQRQDVEQVLLQRLRERQPRLTPTKMSLMEESAQLFENENENENDKAVESR